MRFILSSRVGVEKNEQLRKSSRALSIVTVGQYSFEQVSVFEVCALPSKISAAMCIMLVYSRDNSGGT